MRSTPYSGVVTLADLVRARLFIEDRLIIPLYVNLLTEQHVFARKLRSYGAHYNPPMFCQIIIIITVIIIHA